MGAEGLQTERECSAGVGGGEKQEFSGDKEEEMEEAELGDLQGVGLVV